MIVGVRVRPLSSKESRKGAGNCLNVKDGTKAFCYDPDDKRRMLEIIESGAGGVAEFDCAVRHFVEVQLSELEHARARRSFDFDLRGAGVLRKVQRMGSWNSGLGAVVPLPPGATTGEEGGDEEQKAAGP